MTANLSPIPPLFQAARLMAAGVLAAGFAPQASRPRGERRPCTRAARLAALEARERWGTLTYEAQGELRRLRLQRGKLARRMGRHLRHAQQRRLARERRHLEQATHDQEVGHA